MVYFKNKDRFEYQNDTAKFDTLTGPGKAAPYSGIYRCYNCHHQVVSTKGNTMPPEGHHTHTNPKLKIEWQLVAAAH